MSSRQKLMLGLAMTGFIAGLMNSYTSLFFSRMLGDNAEGTILGILLAAYFWIFHAEHSVWKIATSIASSTVSYLSGLAATVEFYILTFEWLGGNSKNYGTPTALSMFPGGFVGALLLCGTALLLYSDSRKHLVRKTLFCSIGAGFVAVLVFAIARSLTSPGNWESSARLLYLVWPAATGTLLGAVLDNRRHPTSEKESQPYISVVRPAMPPDKPTIRTKHQPISVPGKIFISLVVLAFLSLVTRALLWRMHLSHLNKIAGEYTASRPTLTDLPPVLSLTEEDALLLHPIGPFAPRHSSHSFRQAWVDRPEFADYTVCYALSDAKPCEPAMNTISVEVREYPNPDWASYNTNGLAYRRFGLHAPDYVRTMRVSGTSILSTTPRNSAIGEFYWNSGSFMVIVESRTSTPDTILQEYLSRYPSSISTSH